jgi:hypothetical protein
LNDEVVPVFTDAGVLPELLRKVTTRPWQIRAGRSWKSIRKLRVPPAAHADTRNVRAVALDARECGCSVLAFSRDRDNDLGREKAVEEGILAEASNASLKVVGGVAKPLIEGWLLALTGRSKTEDMGKEKAKHDFDSLSTPPVAVTQNADLALLPEDARSLHVWLKRARDALAL